MIITFCGHSDFQETEEYRQAMLGLLDSIVGKEQVEFFLGNYGRFDKFALSCCQQFKRKHSESTLIFVTPYRDQGYLERHMPVDGKYDEVLYPNIENRPLKFL